MTPTYIPDWTTTPGLARLLTEIEWLRVAETRGEYFMSTKAVAYTYGSGRGVRTYTSHPFAAGVDEVRDRLNTMWPGMNVCFLNRYDNQRQHLGWHADDHEGTDHTKPIAVVSFGAEREIWWRTKGTTGVVPPENRRLLGNGSLFIMPPGFQATHEHRIPKADREVGARISLTFRSFLFGGTS